MLEFNPATGYFNRNKFSPLEADLILVDEASMLDLLLAEKLLQAVPLNATLVLVGDVDQLPPVSAGPVLRDLLDSGICTVVRLTHVFRQARQSAIVLGAHDILKNRIPTPTPKGTQGKGDLFIIKVQDPESIWERLLHTLERIPEAYGLNAKQDVQVLTPMRKGALGTERLNQLLQDKLNPPVHGEEHLGYRPGDKVMQLQNDYEREVFNGDLGEVRHVESGVVHVDMGSHAVAYDRDAQDMLTLAYASTIHKVQGSEFPAVIVILHTTHHVLLSRSLLYTAITRAKRLVVLLGHERAIRRAVSNATVLKTNSRLAERLRFYIPSAAIIPS